MTAAAALPQVRVEGLVEQLAEAESTQYFHSRPRGSQVGVKVLAGGWRLLC